MLLIDRNNQKRIEVLNRAGKCIVRVWHLATNKTQLADKSFNCRKIGKSFYYAKRI